MRWLPILLLVSGCATARHSLAAQFKFLDDACTAGTLDAATCMTERLKLEVAEQQIIASQMAAFGGIMAAQRPLPAQGTSSGPAYITNTHGQTVGYINQ